LVTSESGDTAGDAQPRSRRETEDVGSQGYGENWLSGLKITKREKATIATCSYEV
jgi:hypothetical protein